MTRGVLRQIAELERLSRPELLERWRELYGTEPPGYRRDVLVKRLAYRIQELAHGGVSVATRARLRDHLADQGLDVEKPQTARQGRRGQKDDLPVIGTRLVRMWHGERHEVTVVVGGFEFEGKRYRSLSAVAKVITGSHWNGRLFFGLTKRGKGNGKR